MISSVQNQVYDNWELCVVDDCSPENHVREVLSGYQSEDERIRVVFRDTHGGIAEATNESANSVTGEFVAVVNQHDELTPDALAEMALYVSQHPETDFLYSDHDSIEYDGRRHSPRFKPDWSPELLLSHHYCGCLVAVRRSVFLKLDGLNEETEQCQHYDFVLRATEVARHVGHIPLILYHCRTDPGVSPTLLTPATTSWTPVSPWRTLSDVAA